MSRDTTLPTSGSDLPVHIGSDQRADFAALPTERLRLVAFQRLARLKKQLLYGKPLRDHPTMGDLSDCRKVFFDEAEDMPPRYRIVYRVLPDEAAPRSVDVLSIGRRAYAEAYVLAARRLGRMG